VPKTAATIQWAAFYSDCEHEVHKVTKGHRVTLTYNLYSNPRPYDVINHLGESPAPVQITNLPLHKKMQEVLRDKHFMSDGTYGPFPRKKNNLEDLPWSKLGHDELTAFIQEAF
jgi:hypothetical protein